MKVPIAQRAAAMSSPPTDIDPTVMAMAAAELVRTQRRKKSTLKGEPSGTVYQLSDEDYSDTYKAQRGRRGKPAEPEEPEWHFESPVKK